MATQQQLTEPLLNSSQTAHPENSRKSKNIHFVLLYTFFAFCGRSLWNQSVLPAFVYLIKDNDPVYVGMITAIMGVSQLVTSFPSAILSDRFRRDIILKSGSLVGVVAIILTIVSTMNRDFLILGVALATWGLFWGMSNTSLSALFADSIMDGDRAYYFTNRAILQQLGNSFGPLGALVMFLWLGDDWTIDECAFVISAAQLLCIPALLLLCLMNDDYCVQAVSREESYDLQQEVRNLDQAVSLSDNNEYDPEISTGSNATDTTEIEDRVNEPTSEHNSESSEDGFEEECESTSSRESLTESISFPFIPTNKVIPVIVATSDVLGGLGAGMSVRYFTIFFLNYLHLHPAMVQLIFLTSNLSMAMTSKIAQLVSGSVGRIQTVIMFKWTGLLFLFGMISSYKNNLPAAVVSVCFVLRTAIMNGTGALTRSVLMDEVPQNERAKWSALESVNMFGWAGSAALGGYIIDKESILFNFCVTGIIQFVATIPLFYLFRKVDSSL